MANNWTASQRAALDARRDKTYLVSAAAGSGKTTVLTERIIKTLTDPEHPAELSRLLVVTFTRTAAAELKERISSALSKALAEHPENKHLSRQLFLLGSAQISTIDSFFQRAVRANFEQLDLPASFRLADEGEILPLSLEVLDALIEEYYNAYTQESAGDGLFARLKNNRFAAAIDHLISDRSDGRLQTNLLEFAGAYQSDPEGVKLLRKCADALRADSNREYLETPYGQALSKHLGHLFGAHHAYLKTLQAHLDAAPDEHARCAGLVENDLQFSAAILEALEERSYERLRTVADSFIPGTFRGIRDKTDRIEEYQAWRNEFKDDIKQLQRIVAFDAEEIREEMLETAELVEMLYFFYTDYESRLLSLKNERGILEYNDVRAKLYSLLANEDGTPTPFADTLASQYDAVYIDEYQDVDFIQDRIFSLIGRDHRFMVGDIKQSIYGFRGSEPSIFASYRRAMPLHTDPAAEAAPGNCIFMSENFRCNRPVIRFANLVCSYLFSACEESVGYRPQDDLVCSKREPEEPRSDYPVPVQVALFEAPPRKQRGGAPEDEEENERVREEAVWVAAEISRLCREELLDDGSRITPSDIAILVRNRAHGKAYVKELQGLRIPVASPSANDLLQDPLLFDLLNLLRAIDNPYRDLPLSECLLSPFGGFDLSEISAIRDAADLQVSLYDAMTEAAAGEDALAEKCRDMIAFLNTQRENAAVQPADRLLRLLYLDERVHPYSDLPASLFLYEQARIYQKSSFCGLYGFLDHFSKLLESDKLSASGFSKPENAVRVMTVHQSKGLEMPVVFLSSTGAAFNQADTRKTLLYHRNVGCAAKLYNRATGESEDTALRHALNICIKEENNEENIRTLYVALTRARERLYVTGTLGGNYDNAKLSASFIKRGDRASILGVSSTLKWILAVLENEHEAPDYKLTFHPLGSILPGISFEDAALEPEAELSSAVHNGRYEELVKRSRSFVYPHAHLGELPTKVAASKIASDLLDRLQGSENELEALNTQIELMRAAAPGFETLLSDETKPSAADIGTATHAFLQFCDFQALAERGIDAECERLIAFGFLSPEGAAIINHRHLEAFCKSDLYRMIQETRHVRREQKFSLLLPASRLTEDREMASRLANETIFVQGSIDLLLEDADGRITLIDYKTDRISPRLCSDEAALKEKMLASHGEQLAAYARAVRMLFGKDPADIRIYSIPLGRTVSLPTSDILKMM